MSLENGHIYIEGSDCTGKDSLGALLADKYQITNIQKLSMHSNNPWDADRTGELPSGHPLFPAYLIRSILWDIRRFQPNKVDRQLQISFTAARSSAWTRATGDPLKDVFTDLLKFTPKFQHTFLLMASVEVKQERLKKRAAEGGHASVIDKMVFTKPDFVRNVDSELKTVMENHLNATVINTDSLTLDEVGNTAVARIDGGSVSLIRNGLEVLQADITDELGRFYKEIIYFADTVAKKMNLKEDELTKIKQPFRPL